MKKTYKAFKNLVINQFRFNFLLKQLVLRDFKVRYKRSILGVFWSVLNPVLTSLVLNIVFSTIFKSQIQNFLVYIMSGLIIFNYYSESTNLAMGSIVNGSSLITKVYIPKYIFPLSKILSSGINLLASLIALLFMVLISGIGFNWYYFLLPYGLTCLMMFALGMGYILSTLTVFFGDVQFIYSIALTIWMYFTPIMYPNSVLEKYIFILLLNPLYYYISFTRKIILENTMPSGTLFVMSFLSSVFFLLIGLWVFKKNQDKFILHI